MTQYHRSHLKELEVIRELEKQGLSTFRCAASRGAFDIGGIGGTSEAHEVQRNF